MDESLAVVTRSDYGFAATIDRLRTAIENAGNTVFAVIDQAAAAEGAGTALRPTVLLIFGNPKGGTPVMDAWPVAGLELPLKLLVWEENGVVSVGRPKIATRLRMLGVPESDPHGAAMDAALEKLAGLLRQKA
jgi:uncharacterized protein (DUF302 family)